MTQFIAAGTDGRGPRVININSNNFAIVSFEFSTTRQRFGAINSTFNMCNINVHSPHGKVVYFKRVTNEVSYSAEAFLGI